MRVPLFSCNNEFVHSLVDPDRSRRSLHGQARVQDSAGGRANAVHGDARFHRSYEVAQLLRRHVPREERFPCPRAGLTPFALAMPNEYKARSGNAVESYKAYYMSPEKQRIAAWKKNRPAPEWYAFNNDVIK